MQHEDAVYQAFSIVHNVENDSASAPLPDDDHAPVSLPQHDHVTAHVTQEGYAPAPLPQDDHSSGGQKNQAVNEIMSKAHPSRDLLAIRPFYRPQTDLASPE